MSVKNQIFSVSRNDYLIEHNQSNDIFKFSAFESSVPLSNDGVVHSEDMGFDFQNECTPYIKIYTPNDAFFNNIGIDKEKLQIVVTLMDNALHTRREILTISLSDIKDQYSYKIDLTKYNDLAFYSGFTVSCFISRKHSINEQEHLIWSKSHIIEERNFTVRAAIDGSIFEIIWLKFSDEDKKNVFYYINWMSTEVSSLVATDCFQVNANSELKDQFMRLQKHTIGQFSTRLIANSILTELLVKTLSFADITKPPQPDSLHEKFSDLLDNYELSFEELYNEMKTSDTGQMRVTTEITKFIQKLNGAGTALSSIGFGGYR